MVVFLFTDIEGSTRLWEEHTAEMGEVIARHDAILRERIEASGGRITKHTGDGVTAAFEDGEPIACALETQQRFAAEAWGAIGELRIRAGLHAGEAQFQTSAGTPAGDYFGPPVNATARVMAAAWGGQILLTPEVTRVSSLPRGATLRDLGEHLLKNVSAPQQLYQLEHPQLPWREFPPPRTLSGQSIRQAVDERGSQLAGLDPRGMAVGLLTAILVPALQGDLDPESGALEGNLGVLDDLGAGTLRAFTAQFAGRLRARRRTGEAPGVAEIQALLDRELLEQWQAGGETAAALRADASRLLQAVQGVEATMSAATQEVREALASGLAELADSFGEFRWMLVGVQDTLAEVRARQALQLALQREQLDLQRQHLVKTNLLLHRQRGAPALAELAVEGEVEEPPPADVPCPYKGLAAFEPEDAAYFFGREELVAELTARLAGTRFLAVVGASGSGKSSLVRAGLLPAAWGGALPGSEAWPTLVLTPGAHPLNELVVRLSVLCDDRPASMLRDLEADHRAAELAIRRGLADQPGDVKLLLVVDQFEEIFALCRDEDERRQFIDALLYAVEAEEGRTIVVPTVRADFYGRCADYPALAARMSDGLLVGPMSEGELRAAIERPAAVVGLRLEPGLTEMILDDVAGEPGALPLLSHALLETFARRRGAELTLSGYAASGGVAGAIAQTADTVYGGLDPEQQALARNVFLRLTELGEEGAQDTRRRVAPGELVRTDEEAPAVEAVLKTLADARLITTGEDTVEVAHEALIREWPTLRRWLDKDREGLRIHRHLTEAGQEWSRLERESGELYRGARLAAAGEWAETHGEALNPLEREFLAASRALAEQEEAEREAQRQRELEAAQKAAEAERKRAEEQTRATGRFRRLAAALGVVFVLAVAAALFAGAQQQRAQEQANARATEVVVRTTAEADSLAAGATAQTESIRAAREARLARARELSAAAISNLDVDPERSILLALQAVAATYAEDGIVTREAEDALHRAVLASRVQLTLSGHNDWVRFVAFSPDGTRLATASADGTAKLWDAQSGQELLTLSGHNDQLQGIAFSPDGRWLATSSADGTAKVWDLEAAATDASGRELLTLSKRSVQPGIVYVPVPAGGAEDLGLQAGLGLLVTALDESGAADQAGIQSGDIILKLNGTEVGPANYPLVVQRLKPHSAVEIELLRDGQPTTVTATVGEQTEAIFRSVAFSPDGTRLATTYYDDGTVTVWDLPASVAASSGEELLTLAGHVGGVWGLVFSPDGTRLATAGDDGTARVWDSTSGEELLSLPADSIQTMDVAFSPDGTRIATGGREATAKVWDAVSGERLLTLAGHVAEVWGIAFSPDGMRIATASPDGTAKVWDATTGEALLTLAGHAERVRGVAFSPDGERLVTASLDETARVWDLTPSQEWLTLLHSAEVTYIAISPDGMRLATSSADGRVSVWDASSGQELLTLTGHTDYVGGVAFSPDGTRLATASDDGTGKVWNLSPTVTGGAPSGRELLALSGHTDWVNAVTFSPDATRLATGGADHTAKIWDATSGKALLTLDHADQVWGVAFSPDGTRLATACSDATATLWDAASGEALFMLSGHEDELSRVVFNPDGTRLATASWDNTAKVWDLEASAAASSGQELMTLTGHSAPVAGVAYSPDGTRLATASGDAMTKLWDAASGQELLSLTGHTGLISAVTFSPDGTRLATASWDGTARVYVLPIEDLIALAQSRVTRSLTTEECQQYLHVDACPERP